ncbi:MAG: ABC transporter permease [Cyclobacteriaceae bacterium]
MSSMFDLDVWEEIWQTIRKHKLRTALTSFGVFWGIFMLVLLLGAGNGLHNGVIQNFDIAKNAVFVWTEVTSVPYAGFQAGREIQLTNADFKALQNVKELKIVSPRIRVMNRWGSGGQIVIRYDDKDVSYSIMGDYPQYLDIQPLWVREGRFINKFDIDGKRKIAVLGQRVKDDLFQDRNAIGEYVKINGVPFKVVGVFDSRATGEDSRNDVQIVHIPATTAQQTFNLGENINWFGCIPNEGTSGADAENIIKDVFRKRHKISPDDRQALGSFNVEEEFKEMQGMFSGIGAFSWLVAIGTILAGMIGVGNIMLIIVRERTKEIGIRKSIGAKPWSIISMVVQEALVISSIPGYIGLVVGVALVEGIGYAMNEFGMQSEFFANPEIDFKAAFSAIIVLLIAGIIAGLIPGIKAANVDPVVALRDE